MLGHRITRTVYVIYTLLVTSPIEKENTKKEEEMELCVFI